jgi:hypothetical protein
MAMCKECSNIRTEKWRKENKDTFNEYQRKYRKKRKEARSDAMLRELEK